MNMLLLRKVRWVLITVGLCAFARIALADSIWKSAGESLYKDKKAIRIGDVLTVIVIESASASRAPTPRRRRALRRPSRGAPNALREFLSRILGSAARKTSAAAAGRYGAEC